MPTVAVRHRHVLNHFFLLEIILCDRNRITLTGVSVSLRQLSKKVQGTSDPASLGFRQLRLSCPFSTGVICHGKI